MRTVVKKKVATVRWSTKSHFARVNDTSSICGVRDPVWPGKVDLLVFEAFKIDDVPRSKILEFVNCKTCRNLFERSHSARESCIHTETFEVKR